jgi:hypothetical protein
MKLFHFTARIYLSSILHQGLDGGQIPLDSNRSTIGISLTECDSPSLRFHQWTRLFPQKLAIRLTIETTGMPSDLLMRWRYVPRKLKMDLGWWKKLEGDPYRWWVYLGSIGAQRVVEVFDTNSKRYFNEAELEQVKAEPEVRGKYIGNVNWITLEQALR